MKYSVIVPCYNEERNLPQSAELLLNELEKAFGQEEFEVLFVCDGATDNTETLLRSVNNPHMKVEAYTQNQGKGYAVRHGMLCAKGEIRLFCDCDLAYGTEAVVEMLTIMAIQNADIYVASRRIHPRGFEGYSFGRRLMSSVYYIMLRLLTGLKVSDSQSGLKAFSEKAVNAVFPLCEVNRFAFDLEVLLIAKKCEFAISEMPACILRNSPSSISLSDPFRMIWDVLRIRRKVRKMKVVFATLNSTGDE